MSWASLQNKSYYSLLHSPTNPVRLAERAVQLGLPAIALTDEGSLTGSVAFIKALKNTCVCGHHKNSHGEGVCYGANKTCKCTASADSKDFPAAQIKPILGSELNIKTESGHSSALTLLSKNLAGWKKLISLTSEANRPENINKEKPEISLDNLSKFIEGNLIGISGFIGSEIANALFEDPAIAYYSKEYAKCRSLSSKSRFETALALAGKHQDIFGKENFYLGVQHFNQMTSPAERVVADAMRAISKLTGIPTVATSTSYYPFAEDFDDQRLLVCSDLGSTYDDVDRKFLQPTNAWMKKFFNSTNYYVPSPQQIIDLHEDKAEINNSLVIVDQCETYSILSKPILPHFDCPNGRSPDEYLKDLCIQGWNKKIKGIVDEEKLPQYKEQIREELRVIQGAGLSSYFLIVEDYCREAVRIGQLLGPGRGSSAGSLIAFLLNITKTVDPIKYKLSFERFYNVGRNTIDRTSLPDIDTDFEDRDQIIDYINEKYGRDKVGQMITFAKILGKGALKEVFRIKFPNIPITEVEKITKQFPDPAAISDKLQEMKENGEEPSIIMWSLEAKAKALKEFCYIDEEGKLQGEYATAFKQAIRLEGVKKSQSRHPSGLVISNQSLSEMVPMVYDSSTKKQIAGMEMGDLEDMGIAKFDILKIDTLKKLHGVAKLLSQGDIND